MACPWAEQKQVNPCQLKQAPMPVQCCPSPPPLYSIQGSTQCSSACSGATCSPPHRAQPQAGAHLEELHDVLLVVRRHLAGHAHIQQHQVGRSLEVAEVRYAAPGAVGIHHPHQDVAGMQVCTQPAIRAGGSQVCTQPAVLPGEGATLSKPCPGLARGRQPCQSPGLLTAGRSPSGTWSC